MRRFVLPFAALVSILAIASFVPALAHAGFPPPPNSTIPSHVLLVGRDASGNADPRGLMTAVIRDLANNPMPNVTVAVDFSVTPDMRPAAVQPDPAIAAVDCVSGPMVMGLTGADGSVTFSIVGRANRSAATAAQSQTLRFYADGTLLGQVVVSAFDLDGGGVGPSDLNAWLQDFFSGQYWARADYDGNLTVGPADLSAWLGAFFGSQSVQGGGASCP
jgi:hypothetical protein